MKALFHLYRDTYSQFFLSLAAACFSLAPRGLLSVYTDNLGKVIFKIWASPICDCLPAGVSHLNFQLLCHLCALSSENSGQLCFSFLVLKLLLGSQTKEQTCEAYTVQWFLLWVRLLLLSSFYLSCLLVFLCVSIILGPLWGIYVLEISEAFQRCIYKFLVSSFQFYCTLTSRAFCLNSMLLF